MALTHLFEPIQIGSRKVKNRIVFTAHDTCLPEDGTVNDALVAYYRKRAQNGVGLIVLQVSGIDENSRYSSHLLMANSDACIPGYKNVAQMCDGYGVTLFAQLFHPGREIMETADGLLPVSFSASTSPQERFGVMPRELSRSEILDIVAHYGAAAARMETAGIHGVEIVASHGYLPAQFLSSGTNRRSDEYGGDFANRLRFLDQVIDGIRARTGETFVVGLRISVDDRDEFEHGGSKPDTCLRVLKHVEDRIDYASVVAGTSATFGGAIHIVPPMYYASGYLAEDCRSLSDKLRIPVILTGRINQPQDAEKLIATGVAQLCGMTRALICDPEMPRKAMAMDLDGIRACIACNQACIGHFHKGIPISCIQYPESGRELEFGMLRKLSKKKRVGVVGGGPAGMKAAIVAAQRGNEVALFEKSGQLGGQVRLAQRLPHRLEFGGLITNLSEELRRSGAQVHLGREADAQTLLHDGCDHVIVATGGTVYEPEIEIMGDMRVLHANAVLAERPHGLRSVIVYDTKGDWVGAGVAELLVADGVDVTLAINGLCVAQNLQMYVRDSIAARLHDLGVRTVTYARLFGVDDDSVYFQHTAGGSHFAIEGIDTVVLATGMRPGISALQREELRDDRIRLIGDCLVPRTAEEAVLEGLRVANVLG